MDAVRRLSNLDFNISKIQIGGKKNGIQQRTGEQKMAYLERSRGKKYYGSMELNETIIEQIRTDDRADFNSNKAVLPLDKRLRRIP